ncbi:MAG TPA: Rpn family recombination-promoting nuclease/putative transposase [Candidatus Eisenbergiella merdipullorum]|uniref:Rpn family recombination-promoting nuclease/putative transposase n=1 Tax=Candidatus Eisenbergiella merdipullorum TaxID=2838553 RepID=A0A9D2I835_9FIRM|nr:Rpn family recombination-promoting nuclease/putative transposase [Candidatus Eisenbergiella merdipullorum]
MTENKRYDSGVRKTPLAEEISTAGLRAQYDMHAKRLLSARPILARILQKTVAECAAFTIEQIMEQIEPDVLISEEPVEPAAEKTWITGDDTVSQLAGEGTVTYDIRFHLQLPALGSGQGKGVRLLFDLEAQKEFYMNYRLVTRGIYYTARMISSQKNREFTGSEYAKLKKVYSIWICMNAPQYIGNALTEYRIIKEDRDNFMPEAETSYDKLSVILICLNEKQSRGQAGSLYHFLNTLLSSVLTPEEKESILEKDYGISMETKIRKEMEAMCNLSEAIEERGIERGMKLGMEQGMEQGMELGSFITLSSLVKDGLLRTDEAAKRMNMSEKEFADRMKEEKEK